jgi:hypothetical protein
MFDDMSKVADIADAYVEHFAELDPLSATTIGITGFDDLMTDLSPDGFAARAALDRATIAQLEEAAAVDGDETARQAMLERLEIACELYESGALTSELNVIASHRRSPRGLDLMPVGGRKRTATRRPDALCSAWPLAADHMNAASHTRRTATAGACMRRQCAEWSAGGSTLLRAGRPHRRGTPSAPILIGRSRATTATAELGASLRQNCPAHADAMRRQERRVPHRGPSLVQTTRRGLRLGWAGGDAHRGGDAAGGHRLWQAGLVAEAVAAPDADQSGESGRDAMRPDARRADAAMADDGTYFDIPPPARRIECTIALTTGGGSLHRPSETDPVPVRWWPR